MRRSASTDPDPSVASLSIRLRQVVNHKDLAQWIDGYERSWRAPGTESLEALFASDARYVAAPFDPPLEGLAAISTFWEAERASADEVFSLSWEPVAVERDVGVARVEVRYGDPPTHIYRDLWIVRLANDGRCTAFEEWPFFPGQQREAEPPSDDRSD